MCLFENYSDIDLLLSYLLLAKLGVTAIKSGHQSKFGIDTIGCRDWSDPNGMDCNAYTGDTDCDTELPMLCVKVDHSPRPPYLVLGNGAAMPAAFYYGWARGHISTTMPIKISRFQTTDQANEFCAMAFGAGWEVGSLWQPLSHARFISGMNGTTFAGDEWTANQDKFQTGGWHFSAYGDVRNDTRLWLAQATLCWKN